MNETIEAVPYWLVNIAPEDWPKECPEFLASINDRDKRILSTPDDQYHRLTWDEVQEIIRTNRIDLFQRFPSELRKYLQYMAKLKAEWGSIMDFVLKQRLQWSDLKPSGRPFAHPEDIKILFNDWPYGIEKNIIHLVVWTKFELEDDPATGDLTAEGRAEIDEYVKTTFCKDVAAENIIWFKNWKSLKSVHAVEHFHVMLNNPDKDFIKRITNGDVATMDKIISQQ